jgi:hypothetical protein
LTSETIPRFLSLTYFLTDNLKEVEIILEDWEKFIEWPEYFINDFKNL